MQPPKNLLLTASLATTAMAQANPTASCPFGTKDLTSLEPVPTAGSVLASMILQDLMTAGVVSAGCAATTQLTGTLTAEYSAYATSVISWGRAHESILSVLYETSSCTGVLEAVPTLAVNVAEAIGVLECVDASDVAAVTGGTYGNGTTSASVSATTTAATTGTGTGTGNGTTTSSSPSPTKSVTTNAGVSGRASDRVMAALGVGALVAMVASL